jgi:predicted small secreted protein
MKKLFAVFVLACFLVLQGCGTMVGAVIDTAIEAAKVPFKVGSAAVDAVTSDDDKP